MKTIHKDYWGRYQSSSREAEAKVHAKSIELGHKVGQYRITTHYTVTEFKKASELVWEATLKARGGGRQGIKVDFTKHKPMGQEEDEVAMHWPDPRVNKLVMVEKYTDDDNTTLVVLVLAAILLLVILFNK